MSKICVYCSAILEDDAKFCNVCGRSADTAIPEGDEENTIPQKSAFEKEASEKVHEKADANAPAEESPSSDMSGDTLPPFPCVGSEEEPEKETSQCEEESVTEPSEEVQTEQESLPQKKTCKKEKSRGKLTFGGVLSAIFLTLLIILNVALIFGCALGYGVSKSDIYNYRFELSDGYTFSLSDIKNSDPEIALNTSEIVSGVFDILEHFNYDVENKSIEFDFSDDSRHLVESAMENSHRFEEIIEESVETVKGVGEWFMVCLGGYILLVTVIFIIVLVNVLAKRRSAITVPGIVLMVMGVLGMAFVLICAFTEGFIGCGVIKELFTLDKVIMSTLIATASSTVAGTVLVAIGATGKKN